MEISAAKTKKILESDVNQLRELQIKGEISSVEIVNVFAKRCHRIGRKLNLVTEEYYDEAIEMAKIKD